MIRIAGRSLRAYLQPVRETLTKIFRTINVARKRDDEETGKVCFDEIQCTDIYMRQKRTISPAHA